MDEKNNKGGFTGLSGLTSDVEPEVSGGQRRTAESSSQSEVSSKSNRTSQELPSEEKVSSNKSASSSNGLLSGFIKLLLIIPWQLYLVGGVAGYLYYQSAIEDKEIESFQSNVAYYLTRNANSNRVPPLSSGVLAINLKTRAVDKMSYRFKDNFRPNSAADVSSVLGFECSDKVVGSYSDGATGYQKTCDLYVITVGDHTWSYAGSFTGSEPPNSKKGGGSRTGSHPARDYLRKAGVL